MIDLYGMSTPNVYKISIMLEEIGLPYRIHYVNVYAGDQYKPEFLEIGPNNKVPVIVDHEGPGNKPVSVFESGAILIYLAEKTGKFLSADPVDRTVALQWLMFQMASLGPMLGQLNHFLTFAPERLEYPIERYTNEMRRLQSVLDKRLAKVPYLAGSEYSIADISVVPWIRVMSLFLPPFKGRPVEEGFAEHPSLLRWYQTVMARPGVKRGIEAMSDVSAKTTEAHLSASAEQLDRYLGRGRRDEAGSR